MQSKKEAVRNILAHKGADRIPVIMTINSYAIASYGYSKAEVAEDLSKFRECIAGTRRQLGYDGLCAAVVSSDIKALAGHLPNDRGIVDGSGEGVIRCRQDIEKLRKPDAASCLRDVIESIGITLRQEPDEPLYAGVDSPAGMAVSLLGMKRAWMTMMRDPELFRACAAAVENFCFEICMALVNAGVDFLRFPLPWFCRKCISPRLYARCVSEVNARFFNRLRAAGVATVVHTCGGYGDRFDMLLNEGASAWHIEEPDTEQVARVYGTRVALMGNVPSCSVMMTGTAQQVYRRAFEDCMSAARDGCFILSADCDVPPCTSRENILAMVQAAKDAERVLWG